jgi:hypothetical protein
VATVLQSRLPQTIPKKGVEVSLVTNGVQLHRFDENVHDGMRLGRHAELDARSLQFTVQEAKIIKPAEWLPAIPTLDQGNLGSCVGNAGTYALSALDRANLAAVTLAGKSLSPTDAALNEQFAVELYHESTINDGYPGTYPPDDTGSSGLGACKSLAKAKLIARYTWATSLRQLATLLQTRGVIMGWPWYESWFQPDNHGFVDHGNWQASGVAGGHELYFEALEAWDDNDLSKVVFRFHNSWNDSWGDHGCGRITGATYNTLRTQVDAKQYVPLAA